MKKVLVTDDEAHVRHVIAYKLRQAGIDVTTANNGADAFELAREIVPDLVITDFNMPQLNGLELATRLKATAETAGVPVIMVTSRGFAIEPEQLAQTNIRQTLSKPFSPRDLLGRVARLLQLPIAQDLVKAPSTRVLRSAHVPFGRTGS